MSKKNLADASPAIDAALQTRLVAKFGTKILREGFTGVPVTVQRYYRLVPGNPIYDKDGKLLQGKTIYDEDGQALEDVSYMTPTEFAVMTDIWSWWWSADAKPWPSVSQIAAHLQKSDRTIQRYLDRLENKGFMIALYQYNAQGKQISNRYDFTPFLNRLINFLDEIAPPEKPSHEGEEGDKNARERVTELPGRRVTELPPKSNTEITDTREIDSSSFSTSGKGTAGKTIGNEHQPEIVRTEDHNETLSKSRSNTPPPTRGQGRGTAKEVKNASGYTEQELRQDTKKHGASDAGIPAHHLVKLNGGLDLAEQQERRRMEQEAELEEQSDRPAREIPTMVIQVAEDYATQYDDSHLVQGSVTRFKKIYATAEQVCLGFNETLYWKNYNKAKGVASKRASKRRNSRGGVTRVPYMLTCLENEFFTLEELVYLRTSNPLYTDNTLQEFIAEEIHPTYWQQCEASGAKLDYREWLQSILDQWEHCEKPKDRKNPTARRY